MLEKTYFLWYNRILVKPLNLLYRSRFGTHRMYDTSGSKYYDDFMNCIYDAREELIKKEHATLTPEELTKQLGPHWKKVTISGLIKDEYIDAEFNITEKGEVKLMREAGVPRKPSKVSVNKQYDLVKELTTLLNQYSVRVLPTFGREKDQPPMVAVEVSSFGLPNESEIKPLGAAANEILKAGGYAVALTPAGNTIFDQVPRLFVFEKPDKAPRYDLSPDDCFEILMGRRKL